MRNRLRIPFGCCVVLVLAGTASGEPPRPRTDANGDPLPAHAVARLGSARFRAGAEIKVVAFAPDGKTVVVAGVDNVIRFWNIQDQKETRRLTGHESGISSLAFSPDGKRLASASYDRTVRLWDVALGKEIRKIVTDGVWATSVAFSPDSKTVAGGTRGRVINLWDADSGKKLQSFNDHGGWVTAVLFSKDGKTLISASRDKSIRFWDVAGGKETRDRIRCRGMVYALARSADGTMLASAGADTEVRLWDPSTAADLRRFGGHESSVHALAFSADGKILATGTRFGNVHLFDVKTGKLERIVRASAGDIVSLAFAPDGKTLATGDRTQRVRLWEPGTGKEVRPANGHGGAVTTLAFAPDGKTILTGSKDGELYLWDTATSRRRLVLDAPPRAARFAAFSPAGRGLITMNEDRLIALWDADQGTLQKTFLRDAITLAYSAQGQPRVWVAFSPQSADNRALRFGMMGRHIDGAFQLLDLATGKTVQSFQMDLKDMPRNLRVPVQVQVQPAQMPGHLDRVTTVAVSHQRTVVASGSNDKTVILWDMARGKFIAKLTGHGGWITALAFSADDRLLASASSDGTIMLWEKASRRRAIQLNASSEIRAMRFSPDGRTLLWSDAAADIHRYDIVLGRSLPDLPGHREPVTSLAFSSDGTRLASGSADTTVLLWDFAAVPVPARPEPGALKNPDMTWAALATDDAAGAYQAIWDLTARPKEAVAFLCARMPIDGGKQKTIAERIAELDSRDFPVRQAATEALESVGELARQELTRALQGKPSLEVRTRVERVLAHLDTRKGLLAPNDLRQVRGVQVLEWLNTAESRAFLEALAKGPPLMWQTMEAKTALERSKKR